VTTGLSSLQLDAFFAAAQSLNFSQAAKTLHITQSALTQRIKNLEDDLGITLFVRKPRGVELTDAGTRLLRYCQARHMLEKELLEQLTGNDAKGFGGIVRIAGFSSVVRSVLIPALSPFLRDNPGIQSHFQNAEMRALPELLLTGEVDFIVVNHGLDRADLETVHLGDEEYVLVDSREYPVQTDVYLDHDPDDPTTAQFLRFQTGTVPTFRRSYLDEIYALLDGVALGVGKAVVSKHLAVRDPRLRIVDGHKPMQVPVVLHYFHQPFYTALHKATVAELTRRCPALLAAATPAA
jgi:DNA-binding transcriptional LysR family regulator